MNKKRMLEEVAVVLEEEESKANTPAETLVSTGTLYTSRQLEGEKTNEESKDIVDDGKVDAPSSLPR